MVNPLAWDKGLVFCQCGTCSVWHVLKCSNNRLYEEIRYADLPPDEQTQLVEVGGVVEDGTAV